jgi:hypothetical protein
LECGGSTPPSVAEEILVIQNKYAKLINPAEKRASNPLFVSRPVQVFPTNCAGGDAKK